MSDASSPSTDEPPESATAALIDAARQSDLGLVIGTLLLVYLAATLLTFTDGLNSVVGLMRTLTFLGLVYALAALALNLQWGYAGLFNIGVAGFMALGVYTMGIVVRSPDPAFGPPGFGLPLPVGIVAGMLVAAVVGLLAALPALRLKADYLAIVTLGMSEIIRLFLQSSTFDTFLRDTLGVGTGGGRGMGLPQNPIRELFLVDGQAGTPTALGDLAFGTFGEDGLGIANTIIIDWAYIAVLAAFVIAFYVLLERLGRSPFGRMLKAIREDELVADSLGKNVDLIKIKVFVIGCALMGLAGILWFGSQGNVSPTPQFMPVLTFYVFIAVIIGGSGSNAGAVLGGIVFATVLFEGPRRVGSSLRDVIDAETPSSFADAIVTLDPTAFLAYATDNIAPLQFVFLGLILVFIMHRRPDGILGDRIETAAAVDLSERPSGGETDE
ncbi:branched-chain amino acid ABC transporter permease [Halorubrum lacusprofundi]|jgi:branched-chain amino acid transport system permease protein|uniref:Inner-membrane translocator n=1 Tax=Halorubrum lacusprofundi (strain ATCC 49239 / DSM 5036 / JCM 8891 / ACAM 34) TaxID=416348 RepID=B9LR20_HALLT|nr:branched-chain amino acid ABC transporter permease [Halorubrum lacusprofundi]ACM57674.1 inner-membrane translocator [Halorubrum lacusprofundi ATCC 49239]MCG1005730.1 branched-chain amino acid ABC transporter permease [Halorubrum lacusprofundi]